MLNLSPEPNRQKLKYNFEIEPELDSYSPPKLPRHIFSLESKITHRSSKIALKFPHRQAYSVNPADRATANNLAVNILQYQLKDRTSQQKHQENIHRNLRHRLEVATASGNQELIDILEAEFKQLETTI